MKGSVVIALKEMIVEKFGIDKWKKTLEKAGIDKEPLIGPLSNVDDQTVIKVIGASCETLNITMAQASDSFGEYWVTVYSQKLYKAYYIGVKTAKEFLLKMNTVHENTTKTVQDAHPPKFEYEWKNPKVLIMKYKSDRNLIDIMVGLIKGVGKLYKEDLKVNKLSDDKVEIIFPA